VIEAMCMVAAQFEQVDLGPPRTWRQGAQTP
jgi:hypothetical protein